MSTLVDNFSTIDKHTYTDFFVKKAIPNIEIECDK